MLPNFFRKAVRLNDKVKTTEATRIPGAKLDRYENSGTGLTLDGINELASYYFLGTKRYLPETDELVSMNDAAPLPIGVVLPQEEVQAAIAASAFTPSGGIKRVTE